MNYIGLLEGILDKKNSTKVEKKAAIFGNFVLENRVRKVLRFLNYLAIFILTRLLASSKPVFPCFKALPELAKIYDEFSDQLYEIVFDLVLTQIKVMAREF